MSDSARHSLPQTGRTADLPVRISAPGDETPPGISPVEMSLDVLASDVRRVFGLTHEISDEALLASLVSVTVKSTRRARWLAIFNSPLGVAMSARGCDLSTALGDILSALPQPRS